MNIALDYDGTYTMDPDLWLPWVYGAITRGHTVYLVTMRYPSECMNLEPKLIATGLHIYPTSRRAKRPFMEHSGVKIDVWIDDNPRAVEEDADAIWPVSAPEGQPVDPAENRVR